MKAYAVVGSDDHFVGIWRDRETAEKVMERSAWAKGERIVEMVSAERIAELEAERDAIKAELANVLSDWNDLVRAIGSPTNGGAIGFARALRAESDALKADAERYRYLRQIDRSQQWENLLMQRPIWSSEAIDAAIDAAKEE